MLTMKDVIREGHETLRLKAKDVNIPLIEDDKQTLKLMMEFLINSQDPEISEEFELRPGVGLAAPQINVSKRMIAIYTMDEKNEKLYKLLLVNPKIVSHSIQKIYLPGGEGCLSVDRDTDGVVARNKKVTVRAHLYKPESDELIQVEIRVSGFVSIVLQHEIDHLNGVLYVDQLQDEIDEAEPVIFIDELEEDITEEN